jgi:hypothetical protein
MAKKHNKKVHHFRTYEEFVATFPLAEQKKICRFGYCQSLTMTKENKGQMCFERANYYVINLCAHAQGFAVNIIP